MSKLPLSQPGSRTNGLPGAAVGCVPENPIEAILDELRKGQRFLVCSHSRPDGDAIGSMIAMGMLLDQMGKTADMVVADHVPAIYRDLPWAGKVRAASRVEGQYDGVILLECDGLDRPGIAGLEPYFRINIDHHSSGKNYGHINWIEPDAASVGEMVYRLVRGAGAVVTREMAACLYTTILTDTGGFCYGGTKTSTFELARELTLAGADPIHIAQKIYYSIPPSKLLLLGTALSHLRVEGPLAWLWVTKEDVAGVGAGEEDNEGIVDYAIAVAGVHAAAYFRELPSGQIRLSLRSKEHIDVAAIAESLGGGGHENAAGLTLDGPLERAREEVLGILRQAVSRV